MGKFVVKAGKSGFSFALKAGNGETIGVSEVYTSEAGCMNGIESVKKNAPIANTEDQTAGESAVNPKFEIYSDKKGEYRFRLKAKNGEIILSSEGYKTKPSCQNGVESIKKNAPEAEVEKAE